MNNFNRGGAAVDPNSEGVGAGAEDKGPGGVWGLLTPKRTKELIGREHNVAQREAEVARREAEILAGAPGGVISTPSVPVCPPCMAATTIETIAGPIQTVIKEIVKEDSLAPPGWASPRVDEILDRELKVAEREREISKREESINRREHDAARRESWIMEQLIALGNDNPQTVEEEHIYEAPVPKRKAKYKELPPLVISKTQIETHVETVTATQTVQVPPPNSIRQVATPAPSPVDPHYSTAIPKTTAVEIIHEEIDDYEEEEEEEIEERVVYNRGPRRPPARWFGGGW
ncbi:hypothetical protein PM082_013068 [Marasmius tenuissimus]|nr:hypothetical protein PM082_013068 [Marasmius tenuissimus]